MDVVKGTVHTATTTATYFLRTNFFILCLENIVSTAEGGHLKISSNCKRSHLGKSGEA